MAEGDAEDRRGAPARTVTGEGNEAKFAAIAKLVTEWQAAAIGGGAAGAHRWQRARKLTRLCRKFGRRLHGRFGLPVYWVDERLSSLYAESLLAEAQVFGRKQKPWLDQVAAQAILQGFSKAVRRNISMAAKRRGRKIRVGAHFISRQCRLKRLLADRL